MKLFKYIILITTFLLVACGGSSSSDEPKLTTKIEKISLNSELIRGQSTSAIIECVDCLKDKAIYRWEIDNVVVSQSSSFTPDFEHLDKAVVITVQVPSIDQVMSDEVSYQAEVISRKTKIEKISLNSELIRGQSTSAIIECVDCLKDKAIYRWEVDNVIVSQSSSLTPDFEHLDKTVVITVQVPSIDQVMSDEISYQAEIISRKTKVESLELTGKHTPNTTTLADFTCDNCLSETISMQWFIGEKLVATGASFTPDLNNFDKPITIKAKVTSIDNIVSETTSFDFIKPTPISGNIYLSDKYILMSNGELIFDSSHGIQPEDGKSDFVNAYYGKHVWGTVLAQDTKGKFFKYGDGREFYSHEKESSFEDIKEKINNVKSYWLDFYGEHVLTSDGKVITWDNTLDDSGNFEYSKAQLSQTELNDVKQVLHSLYDCSSSANTSAVLYNSGLLVIDGFWWDKKGSHQHSYKRVEKTGVSKIQAVSYAGGGGYDAVAIFDEQDNVEIWTCSNEPFLSTLENGEYATGFGDLQNVARIISPLGSKAILAIKKDGSFSIRGSGLTYHVSSLNTEIKVKDLLKISWMYVLLDVEGNIHYLDSYWSEYLPEQFPEFSFDNIAYSVPSDHSNGVVVKEDGSALLITQNNPQTLPSVKDVNLVDNFMLITDKEDKLITYYERDSERELDADYFSNGINQIEGVSEVINLGNGYIIKTKLGEFILVQTGGRSLSHFHEKINRPIEAVD
ncbi:hypothetical protein [Pseudoalteromonas sp. NC201]|uniref:hypothetical protein n=1 Tax=Pseudoalteromonas sp. NC201 TaxID=1514074 RepID=UPI000C7ABD81|nr:hypothetical protein [Pseudoalteromonas sp. NC201]AUJ69116.1 hypothetical protein PNC201_03905 [Pseudoalteromonas sp. NC201]